MKGAWWFIMNKDLRSDIFFEAGDFKKAEQVIKLWDTLLLWSGYEGFYTIPEIAYKMKIRVNSVGKRVKRFKELYPEAFEKLNSDRKAIKNAHTKLHQALKSPTPYDTKMDIYIKEKF
jgi:hypothetical protein